MFLSSRRGEDSDEEMARAVVSDEDDSSDEESAVLCKRASSTTHLLPSSHSFRIFKYRNPGTSRQKTLFKCDIESCQKRFVKLHNFLDHLRTHTG